MASRRSEAATIQAIPLDQKEYSAYGDVISARRDIIPVDANGGTAKRFNFVAKLENLRPGKADANLCLFRCAPQIVAPRDDFDVKILEKHPLSTQAFIPMHGEDRFLVIVCLGKEQPDLSTLRAFIASKSQGITYKPGVWHHPLVAMERQTDFACLVWENGASGDCEVVKLTQSVIIKV